MPHANFNIGIKAILQNSEGQILALGAHDNGPMAGFNDMPGGRIDDNEVGTDFSEILKREINEELGDDIQFTIEPKPIAAVSWLWPNGQPMAFIYFLVKYESGEIKTSDEHTDFKWVDLTTENISKYFTTYHKKALELLNRP